MPDRFGVARHGLAAGLLALGLIASACGGGANTQSAAPAGPSSSAATSAPAATGAAAASTGGRSGTAFPGSQWEKTDPASAGMDAAKLDEIAERAKAGGSNCFLVVRDGKVVKESYWNDTTSTSAQEVFSATKSYTAMLVGIAQDEGKLSIDDKASKYIPEWAGSPSDEVTIKHLLSNNSGRHWDFKTDYSDMAVGAKDKTAFSVGLTQDGPPASVWAYNNSAIQTLSGVLKKATGEEASNYAKTKLLGPIGMASSEMRKDPSGGTLTFMGLSSTCQDMARFGHLLLNKGNWNGTQVIPEAYVNDAVGHSSQDLNAAYGYLVWLNRRGKLANPAQPTTGETAGSKPDGQMVPGAPDDMYWALGMGNQIISVDPGTRTVVVRLGPVNVPKGSTQFTQKDTAEVATQAVVRR